MAKWGHTLKVFIIIIVVKTPFYLLKINKRTNKKYLRNSNFMDISAFVKYVFYACDNFFDILVAFVSFLQTCYDIYLCHIFSLSRFLYQIILYIYFLLFLLIILCYFHKNLLLCLKFISLFL